MPVGTNGHKYIAIPDKIQISKSLDIPKETVRRKINYLQDHEIIFRSGKSIYLNSKALEIIKPNNSLPKLAIFFEKMSESDLPTKNASLEALKFLLENKNKSDYKIYFIMKKYHICTHHFNSHPFLNTKYFYYRSLFGVIIH